MNRLILCAAGGLWTLAAVAGNCLPAWEKSSVIDVAGVPRIVIDGKAIPATAVMPSPAGKPGAAVDVLKTYHDIGIRMYSDVWTMHDKRYNPRQWWLGEGEYDFELFDAMAKGMVDASPDGFIFPRIKIDPPAKWCVAHPEEMLDGLSPKPESKAWRVLYLRMLKDMIAHVEKSSYANNVIGYQLGAFHCGEWLTGEWKKERRAYIPSVSCKENDALPPLEVTAAARAAISQRSRAVAEMLVDAAACVKEFTAGKKLVGAFFGYSTIAHEKISDVLKSGKVDFFAAPPHYFAVREPGESGRSQAYYQASYRLHGRVFYEESDFRTYLSLPCFTPPKQNRMRPLDESLSIIRRSIGKSLAGGWENWWFLLGGNASFSSPEMMESIKIGAEEEFRTLATAKWRPAEVAVFTAADEYATSYCTHAKEFRLQCKEYLHRHILPACGVPFDSYELSDIGDSRLPDYKIYLFPNAFTLSEEMRKKIKEKVRRAGKTAIWVYAPGYYRNGIGDKANVEDMTGVAVERKAAKKSDFVSWTLQPKDSSVCVKDGWRSVFMPTPPSAAELRNAFRDAGAHVWVDTEEVLAAGRGYVMLHASSDGMKTLRLPSPCNVREIFGASPSVSGTSTITAQMKRGETRVWKIDDCSALALPLANHMKITSFDLMDQTDVHNELLRTREWTAQWNERTFNIATCALDIYDCENDTGRVFLRLAPLPHSRPVKCDDFCVDSVGRKITVLSNGYPFVMREYKGGKVGRIKAFHALQRELRPYRSGRDGRILSNNWGGGYSDSRLNQDYAMREIEAGAKLGVDVVQLDDGWQKGRSANSLLIKNRQKEGVWNGYWAFDPNFWDADPIRFSGGFKPLVTAAKSHGMDFGLWYGPDSSNDAANWERDADRLLKYFRETGIRYFKIDSMKSFTPLALSRQRAMFDKVLAGSSSNVVFDLDVTAEIRPGYFGLPDIGTLFVENRYAKHCSWWPHQTLRNLWSLAEVVDPVRLRMEFLDPRQHADRYAERYPDSPLRPELWSGDAVFATVMVASPLAWMEMQGLHHETVAEMSKIIARWKLERERIHTGDTFPVGSKPDGFSWTGFVTSALDGKGGYALLFRECADAPSFTLDLSPYISGAAVETLAGDGTAKLEGGVLTVEIPRRLGYLWLKIR